MTNHIPTDFNFTNELFEFFTGSAGPDNFTITLDGPTFIGLATLSDTVTDEGLYVTDGATDTVTIDGGALIDPTGLEDDTGGRAVSVLGFGPEDEMTITNISGDEAQVFLFRQENPGDVPSDFFYPGAIIDLAGRGTIVIANPSGSPFVDQADFNDSVRFAAGGTPSFGEVLDLSQIWDQFSADGTLPENEIPGVFELPDEPQAGDTVDIPPITITIGGEEVTFDPGDPFWFDDLPAEVREEILADPEIAVGYDYRIVNPEPGQAFATIRAPEVGGDTSYNLVVITPEGESLEARTIQAGELVDLEVLYDQPVTNFVLEGITPDANLNPDDARAFPLAVSFTQAGAVDMQQTPLVRGFDFGTETAEDVKGTAAAFYIGYYGRAPEPAGFSFWQGEVQTKADNGEQVFAIAENLAARFRDADETKALYPFLDREAGTSITDSEADAFVTDVYQNLFNRDPETAGLDFWSDEVVSRVTSGESIADIIITIMDGAGGDDAVTVGNKIDVAVAYGDAFTAERFANDRDSLPDINAIVDDVDATDASVDRAINAIEAAQDAGAASVEALGFAPVNEDLLG